MARCQSCGKLCSLETEDPDAELEIAGTVVQATVHLVRNSACCGDEVKSADFEPEEEIDPVVFAGHLDKETLEPLEGHELEVEVDSVEATERCEGKGRGTRTFYGFSASYEVRCSCQKVGDDPLHTGTISDEIQASHMEENS